MTNKKALLTIFLIVFIDLLGFGIILPLLPYIAEKYQASPFSIGILSATYSFFQLIAAPLLGRLSDRFGRKKLLIISQIGSAFGYLILGLANSLPALFLARIVDGITGGNISIAQAYIADTTSKKDRASGMGLIGAAFGLGFIFGPAIGGFLSKFSYSLPAFFAAFISLITVFTTILFLEETVDEKEASTSPRRQITIKDFIRVLNHYPVGILMTIFFIVNFSFSVMQGVFALWTERTFKLTAFDNGWLFTYVGITGVLVQLLVLRRIVKVLKEKQILQIGIFSMFLGLFLIPLTKNRYWLFLPLTFLPLGNGLSNPVIQSLVSEDVSPEEYGEALGMLQTAGAMGRIIGPIAGSAIFQQLDKNTPFYFSSFLLIFVLFYLQLKLKNHKSAK